VLLLGMGKKAAVQAQKHLQAAAVLSAAAAAAAAVMRLRQQRWQQGMRQLWSG
jgi:hypothetical protein